MSDCVFGLSGFRPGSLLSEPDHISTQIYHGSNNVIRILIKSVNLSASVNDCAIESRIEILMNLRHSCIAGVIGVVFSSLFREFKVVRRYSSDCSLSTIITDASEWWTPTAKAKAVVGLVLGLRFSHSLGLLHGHPTTNNVFFEADRMIQISDFCMNTLQELESDTAMKADVQGFSRENWTPNRDVLGFVGILSEIVVGASAEHGGGLPAVPSSVSEIIEKRQLANPTETNSFSEIFEFLKQNDFKIMEGVNFNEVSNFVNWIEGSESLSE
jgi:hypothetical protein